MNFDLDQIVTEGRAKNRTLAELLTKIVGQLITPIEDPLYDWQIVSLVDVRKAVEARDAHGQIWRTVPDVIRTRNFEAPIAQCALAYGSRLAMGNTEPTPLALLVWATKGDDGRPAPVIGASFYYSSQNVPGRWFTRDTVDARTADAICAYLNGTSGVTRPSSVEGINLDDEEEIVE